jgi:hypothetical protein
LVGWVGGRPPVRQPGVNVAISIGRGPGVGWFPLTPRERYVPGFRSSPRYERELNRSHLPHFNSPRDRADRNDRVDRGDRDGRGDAADRRDRGDRNDRNDRDDRNDRVDRGDRGDRPSIPPRVDRGVPSNVTTVPPQVSGTLPGAAPLIPGRPRPGDRGDPRGARGESPNPLPGLTTPGAPLPVPRPSVRPPPPQMPQAAPAIRSADPPPVNPELMRRPETRKEWLDAVRENELRRQAPAGRAEPVAPAVESDAGRGSQRGAGEGYVRRERPVQPGGTQRLESGDGRERRNSN